MDENKVVSINKKDNEAQRRKADLLEMIDYIKKQIETDNVTELVACSLDADGMCQIHVGTLDSVGAVGLFEIGKTLLIQQDHQY